MLRAVSTVGRCSASLISSDDTNVLRLSDQAKALGRITGLALPLASQGSLAYQPPFNDPRAAVNSIVLACLIH